jgi:hypothetical protein
MGEMFKRHNWAFTDPKNLAVITLRQILDRERPILYVSHDADDKGWQFLTGDTLTPDDARVVGLGTIAKLDPSVFELADLPLGWKAWRLTVNDPWQRASEGH